MSNTSRSKSLALMFLLGAFLTGGAIGFAADRAMIAKQSPKLTPREELARELGLSPQQRDSVFAILDWRNALNQELWRPLQPVIEANRDSARVLIMQQLSPEQQQAFRAVLERNEAEQREKQNKRNQNASDQ